MRNESKMKLNIDTTQALEDRNSVLALMGFDTEEEEATVIEATEEIGVSKYGELALTEVANGVFEVNYQKEALYNEDLKSKSFGYFVGE